MAFLSLLITAVIAYLIWRISDQLPDLMFRLSEIQRDVSELRKELAAQNRPDTTNDAANNATGTDDE